MKKTFALHAPGQETQRLVESIKNDVRKYIKRERRKALPMGVDFWDFDCKVGAGKNEPTVKHPAELVSAIDAAAADGSTEVYVEILAKPGLRTKKIVEPAPSSVVTTDSGTDASPEEA